MSGFLTIVLVIVSIVIVFVVIMQPSKDGGLGGLSNGGAADSVLGTGGNAFLTKATWWLMAIFLISSLALAKRETSARIAKESAINKKSAIEEIDLKGDTPDASGAALKSATTDAEKKAAAKTEETTKKVETAVEGLKKEVETKKADAEKVEAPKVELPKVETPATK